MRKISEFKYENMFFGKLFDSFNGWKAYAIWANSYKLRKRLNYEILDILWERI